MKTIALAVALLFVPLVSAFAAPTLPDVLGGLDPVKVRKVYRYSCDRTFLEGEGVSMHSVECLGDQRLGLITAPYHFYLYDGKVALNGQPASILDRHFRGKKFEGPICNRELTKLSCSAANDLRYGLYGEMAGKFVVGISYTTAPEASGQQPADVLLGYAALPDNTGNCPAGLVKIRPFRAMPGSIISGSIDGTNPPSNFINQGGFLDDSVVETSAPAPLAVSRQANAYPCKGASTDPNEPTGSCRDAAFAPATVVQQAGYLTLSPVVCTIPPELL